MRLEASFFAAMAIVSLFTVVIFQFSGGPWYLPSVVMIILVAITLWITLLIWKITNDVVDDVVDLENEQRSIEDMEDLEDECLALRLDAISLELEIINMKWRSYQI